MLRLGLLLLALLTAATPARADDIAATGRGVVRVVTIAVVDGAVVGFGHGSGVAVAPNRIVTNAHVVELAERYPDNVLVGVVPSEGARSYRGRVVAYDAAHDLALIEFAGARLPPAALFADPVSEGQPVVALGYPGNVDLATARSAADYISPVSPVRSEGVVSGRRSLTGTDVLLHTAPIARGNSGGPLLDRCGRVVGINSAITRGEEGDTAFGFAIAEPVVAAFLRRAGQPVAVVSGPCVSMEDRLREDSEAGARDAATADVARREAIERRAARYQARLEQAREQQQRERDNALAGAGLFLVAGAQVLGFAASSWAQRRSRPDPRIWAVGVALLICAVAAFTNRPTGPPNVTVLDESEAEPAASRAGAGSPPDAPARPGIAPGKLVCRFQPDRSRVTVSQTSDVTLAWQGRGCADGRRWVAAANGWEQVSVAADGAVAVRRYDPALHRLEVLRYLLTTSEAAPLVRESVPDQCDADPAALARAQAAIRAALPPLPNEKLSYACAPSPAQP